jgi:hypothetical protein
MSYLKRSFMLTTLIVLVICVPILLFWLWMMIECATKESNEGNTKLV